ncbi:hypothetical protein [Microbacterium sp. 1262]|uniref:hypothetical protein n=1 Tax=Microbacterium sp. 1262 TaxID=3156415 RepID=UPI003392D1AA
MTENWKRPDAHLRSRFSQPRFTVRIGETDVSEFASNIVVFEEDRLPHARLTLTGGPFPQFDYLADVAVLRPGSEEPYFGGTITAAETQVNALILDVFSVSEFREYGVSPFALSRVGAPDLINMQVRGAGFSRDRVKLSKELQPTAELFEVAVPVLDCDIESALTLNPSVRLLPMPEGLLHRFKGQTNAVDELAALYRGAKAIAVTHVSNVTWMSDAEEEGVAVIRRALDWLLVLMRNGASVGSDGTPASFRRDDVRGFLRQSSVAIVTGMQSGRSWARDLRNPVRAGEAQLDKTIQAAPSAPADERSSQSFAAFRRAADEQLPIAIRVSAIWEALEYYAADVRRQPSFQKHELRALRKRAVDGLTDDQSRRVEFAIAQLNSSSLQERIWHQASLDGVRVSSGDRNVIARTRGYRNALVHGGDVEDLTRGDVNYAVSVVSRLLLGSARSRVRES